MVEETGMYAIQAIFDELPHTETEMKLEQKSTDLILNMVQQETLFKNLEKLLRVLD